MFFFFFKPQNQFRSKKKTLSILISTKPPRIRMAKGLSRISPSSPPKRFTPETERQERSRASQHKGNRQLWLKIKLADAAMKGPGKPLIYTFRACLWSIPMKHRKSSAAADLNIYSYPPPVLSLWSY